jgi:hypothetical protein
MRAILAHPTIEKAMVPISPTSRQNLQIIHWRVGCLCPSHLMNPQATRGFLAVKYTAQRTMTAGALESEMVEFVPLLAEANFDAAFDADHKPHAQLFEKRK